jgi:hypothetical protein
MKYLILSITVICYSLVLHAQKYPEPEFTNEVYLLKKDSTHTVIRLEKGSSKMEAKTNIGGYENGYIIEGEKSAVRVSSGNRLSFVYSTGASASASSSQRDSIMRANGMDPAMMQGMGGMGGMNDPASTIILYKIESEKGKRKILMQKSGGAMPFASKKIKSSEKFTFSVKKIKEGYWELVIDKSLPRGEYAFTTMGMGMGSMDGSTTIFSFAVN